MTAVGPHARIRIAAILGTSRPRSFTERALRLVLDELAKQPDVETDFIDPSGLDLAFPGRGRSARELSERVRRATGVILATPEYHGSFAATLKLVIENLGFPSALAGKPVALLGVAAGRIGAIKSLEHLGSVCAHVGALVLPGPVSVARVKTVFDEEGRCTDPEVERMVRGVARRLLDYISDAICPAIALEAMARAE